MTEFESVTPEEITRLKNLPSRSSGPKKDPTEDRTYPGWFRLRHTTQRDCEVPGHDHKDPNTGEPIPRNRMTTIINDVAVCRYCFLAETDKPNDQD